MRYSGTGTVWTETKDRRSNRDPPRLQVIESPTVVPGPPFSLQAMWSGRKLRTSEGEFRAETKRLRHCTSTFIRAWISSQASNLLVRLWMACRRTRPLSTRINRRTSNEPASGGATCGGLSKKQRQMLPSPVPSTGLPGRSARSQDYHQDQQTLRKYYCNFSLDSAPWLPPEASSAQNCINLVCDERAHRRSKYSRLMQASGSRYLLNTKMCSSISLFVQALPAAFPDLRAHSLTPIRLRIRGLASLKWRRLVSCIRCRPVDSPATRK